MSSIGKIICNNGGTDHEHTALTDFIRCIGTNVSDLYIDVRRRAVPATATPVAPPSVPAGGITIRRPADPPSIPQLEYIRDLGGSWRDAKMDLNRAAASALIDILKDPIKGQGFKLPIGTGLDDDEWDTFPMEKAWQLNQLDAKLWWSPKSEQENQAGAHVPAPHVPDQPASNFVRVESKLKTMLPLIQRVPDGYYAPMLDENEKMRFFRFSCPTRGRYAGALKVQEIVSDRLEVVWVHWQNGRTSVFRKDIEDHILAIVSDYAGCARRYAREINACCRCNTQLTDGRSRKYGIGPECEKFWPWMIEQVDLELAEKEGF